MNGKRLHILVDSGSNKTIVRTDVVEAKEVPEAQIDLCGVTGHRIPLRGPVDVELQVGATSLRHSVYMADIEDPCILGLDFMTKYDCKIDIPNLTMEAAGVQVPLQIQAEHSARSYRITTQNAVRVPPMSEVIVHCCAEGVPDTNGAHPALIEGSEIIDRGLLVGRTLVDCGRKAVPALVANISDKSISLPAGTLLGTCESVSSVEEVKETPLEPVEHSRSLPAYLQDLYERSHSELNPHEAQELRNLLTSYGDVFSRGNHDLGCTDLTEHTIDTGDQRPIKLPPRKVPLGKRDEAEEMIRDMKQQGLIEPSKSPWSFPVVMVKKKDGSLRFCIDYRALNQATVKDSYPLPRIDDTLDALSGSKWFSTLDLKSGYHQVKMADQDKEKTAFCAGGGLQLWQFRVMPFGLCNAPATFERLMERVLDGLNWKASLVYLDDVIVLGKTFKEQFSHLEAVFKRLLDVGLKLNPKKCNLFQRQVKYLGHVVSHDGIAADADKTRAVEDWPVPRDQHQLRSFLGLCTYYRRFVRDFALIAAPLHQLTKKGQPFKWSEECQEAFIKLKQHLVTAPILAYPNATDSFVLDTDASSCSIGGVLSQVQEGQEHVIAYFSRSLSSAERNYCVTRRELLGIVDSMKHFHHYLYGKHFVMRTDHAALQWLKSLKEPEGQLARWIARADQYDYDIQYRPGRVHCNADALSRRPCQSSCKHCGPKEPDRDLSCRQISVPNHRQSSEAQSQTKADERASAPAETEQVSDVRHGEQQDIRTGDSDEPISKEEIRSAQLKDPNTGPIVRQLETSSDRPAWDQVSGLGLEAKGLWARWDALKMREGLLMHKWESPDGFRVHWQVVIPRQLRSKVLQEHHDSITSGHLGTKKTLGRLRSRFFWLGMRSDVKEWCRSCSVCCAKKGPQGKPQAPLQIYTAGAPMERVAVDIAGPLPVTSSGNRYICVAMDYFTKWPEAYAIPNQEATTVARVLVDQFFTRFGVPFELHSDQGRNFESKVFRECCNLLGIRKTRTTPLRPQSDGMVEKFNWTLGQELAKFCAGKQDDWDEKLPLLLMAYRSAEHEVTDYSPAHMMMGRDLRLPVDLVIGRPTDADLPPTSAGFVLKMKGHLDDVHHEVRRRLKIAADAMKTRHDAKACDATLAVGDAVWFYNPRRVKGQCPKLMSDWDGPYEVTHRLSNVTYRIRRGPRAKPKVVHANRLWKCHSPKFTWKGTCEDDNQDEEAPAQGVAVETAHDADERRGSDLIDQHQDPTEDPVPPHPYFLRPRRDPT